MSTIVTSRPAGYPLVDSLHQDRASVSVQAIGVVGFALLTVLAAQVRIFIWEVPITLQTLAVYGSGLYLGWRNGAASQVLYILLGLFFPVYAGDGYGAQYLLGAVSAGYLFGFPVAAGIAGALAKRWSVMPGVALAMLAGSVALFSIGVVWLHFAAGHATWAESLDRGWLRFIPADLAKIILLGLVYTGSRQFVRKEAGS